MGAEGMGHGAGTEDQGQCMPGLILDSGGAQVRSWNFPEWREIGVWRKPVLWAEMPWSSRGTFIMEENVMVMMSSSKL